VCSTTVNKIITGRAGDDQVLKLQAPNGRCHPSWLGSIWWQRLFAAYIAEAAAAGAAPAKDKKGRLSLAETFADIGAERFLTDRMQLKVTKKPLHLDMG
jgi:hypothetical protein